MKKIKLNTFCLLLIVTFFINNVSGQTVREIERSEGMSIMPLQIGDTIPAFLWNYDLSVTNLQSGKHTAKLKDFRGQKLTIIDFWATWCSPCIKGMPKLDSLVKAEPRIAAISVGFEDRIKIERFLEKKPLTYNTGFDLPVVVEDKILRKYFPHQRIPHYVWIDENGKIIAFVSGYEMTDSNIKKVLDNKQITAEMKIDYDKTGPLFGKGNRMPEFGDLQYYALLSKGYKEGMGSSNRKRVVKDKIVGNLFTNGGLYKMYAFLIDQVDPDNFKKDHEFHIGDIEKFDPSQTKDLEKIKQNAYCFDYWNLNGADSSLYWDMIRVLNRASPYELVISQRKKRCYVLEDINPHTAPHNDIEAEMDEGKFVFDTKASSRHLLVYLLNKGNLDMDVINRSKRQYYFRYGIKGLQGAEQINHALRKYGLRLVKRNMRVNHYLFKEKGGIQK